MNNEISLYLNELEKNKPGVTNEQINKLLSHINFKLPNDYLDLMKEFNGGEGAIGENSWLYLFPLDELLVINDDYNLVMEQIPDYFLFGKDAADTGYAFNKKNATIHSLGLMSDFKTDPIEFCGNSMIDFLKFLYKK